MNDSKQFRLTSDVVVGLVLVLLGLLFVLDNFDVIDASVYLRYWPLLLVIFGGIRAVQPGPSQARLIGGTIGFIGLLMLLDRFDVLSIDVWDLWPLLLVAAGIAIAMRHGRRRDHAPTMETGIDGRIRGTALLGGLEIRSQANPFRGGSISATLGGAEVHLGDAVIPDGETVDLEVFAFMGGVEIRVPRSWHVEVSVTSILGGVENRASEPVQPTAPRLRLHGTATFGGIEIRN